MNISNSECSSGCESGWTMYFDQISNSTDNNPPYTKRDFGRDYKGLSEYVNEDDEDLSMVSDASSGPPHYSYASSVSEDKNKNKQKKLKSKVTKVHKQQQSLGLDDTASSPVYNFPPHQDNVAASDYQHVPGFSQAFNVEGESITKKHLGFFKSSTKGKSTGNSLGRKRQ